MIHGEYFSKEGNWYYYDIVTGIMLHHGRTTLPDGRTYCYDEVTGVPSGIAANEAYCCIESSMLRGTRNDKFRVPLSLGVRFIQFILFPEGTSWNNAMRKKSCLKITAKIFRKISQKLKKVLAIPPFIMYTHLCCDIDSVEA